VKVLVAGIGNVFLGDDGFGVEVVRRLSTEHAAEMPPWVRVVDYGVRGMHLAYDLAGAGYDRTIMIDAMTRGGAPGTVYVVQLDRSQAAPVVVDAHGMQPDVVLNLVAMLGADPGPVLLVGCEPAALDQRMGLSPPVESAVAPAARAVLDLIAALDSGTGSAGSEPGSRKEPPCAWASPAKWSRS
jgi:hydrogenase maturation protease